MKSLFDTSDFPPRWECGEWSSPHGWVHILSDLAIFAAYFTIPLVIIYFVLKKKLDVPFHRILFLFGAFILLCGTTHLIESIIFYHPVYRLGGAVKLATALVSWTTVIALIRVMPEALKLPGLNEMNLELQQTNQQLLATNRDLDEFARGVSHDLKAPIRGIVSLTEWLEEDLKDTNHGEVQENLELLRSRTLRIEQFVEGILSYSRLRNHEPEYARFSSKQKIRSIIDLLNPGGIDIQLAEVFPDIEYDEALFHAIMQNLISNAVKYGGAMVHISADETPTHWAFIVADQGPGISPENLERIRRPFETLQSRDVQESTGLGLSIVEKLVSRMGGHLDIASNVGEGTACTFTVPKTPHRTY